MINTSEIIRDISKLKQKVRNLKYDLHNIDQLEHKTTKVLSTVSSLKPEFLKSVILSDNFIGAYSGCGLINIEYYRTETDDERDIRVMKAIKQTSLQINNIENHIDILNKQLTIAKELNGEEYRLNNV